MNQLKGSCLCGKVQYQLNQTPIKAIQCHCINCQKQSGSAFSINLVVNMTDVALDKKLLSHYEDKGDSGREVHRFFCGNCGSPIATGNSELTGVAVIKAGTLNDTTLVQPQLSIWERSAQSWIPKGDNILHCEKSQPSQ